MLSLAIYLEVNKGHKGKVSLATLSKEKIELRFLYVDQIEVFKILKEIDSIENHNSFDRIVLMESYGWSIE